MAELLLLILAFAAGLVLGLIHVYGLWWTVRRLPDSRNIPLLLLGSFTARTLVLLAGLFLVMDGDWRRLVAAMLGLITMRIVLTRRIGPAVRAEGVANQ